MANPAPMPLAEIEAAEERHHQRGWEKDCQGCGEDWICEGYRLAVTARAYWELVGRMEAEIRACENHATYWRGLNRMGKANVWAVRAQRARALLTPIPLKETNDGE